VWLRNGAGKALELWSEDHPFTKEPVFVTVNPREFVEYSAQVATRDMKPGELYTVQASILGYDGLTIERVVIPEK
jgi:hypothetical protein